MIMPIALRLAEILEELRMKSWRFPGRSTGDYQRINSSKTIEA